MADLMNLLPQGRDLRDLSESYLSYYYGISNSDRMKTLHGLEQGGVIAGPFQVNAGTTTDIYEVAGKDELLPYECEVEGVLYIVEPFTNGKVRRMKIDVPEAVEIASVAGPGSGFWRRSYKVPNLQCASTVDRTINLVLDALAAIIEPPCSQNPSNHYTSCTIRFIFPKGMPIRNEWYVSPATMGRAAAMKVGLRISVN